MLRKTSINTSLLMSVFLVAMVCSIASGGTINGVAAVPPTHATNPNPPDGAEDVSVDTNLTWMRGEGAKWDQVYFGTDPCDANLSLVATIPDSLPAEYDPGDPDPGTEPNLIASTTYYWYITEVNGPNEYPGPVWSFTTLGGEAQCDYPEDGAVIPGHPYIPNPAYTYTELIFIPGPTALQHNVYFSKVRDEVANRAEVAKFPWPEVTVPEYEPRYYPGLPDYFPYESLIRGQVYYWTVDANDALGNVFPGEIWSFGVQPYEAFVPSPPNEAVFISTDVELSWLAGYGAQLHDVFFGTDKADVNNAYFTYPVPFSSPEYVDTTDAGVLYWQMNGLDPETRYYWRIDEVMGRIPPCIGMIYKGDVWCFTTRPAVGELFVDIDAAGANNGTSWADAYNYLQDALADANSSEKPVEISVAEGVYKPDHGKNQHLEDQYASFQLQNLVTIKGGYGGIGEPDPNARDIAAYETILSGEISDDEDTLHVVCGSGTDATAVLDGFTITGGCAWSSNNNLGGGMYSYAGSPTIRNCTFTNNRARNYGGGMCNDGNSCPLLINCIFVQNSATDGGGMDNEYSHPILINCVFAGNWVDEYNADEFSGGAIYNFYSNPTLINCTITANAAMRWGECGGIYNSTSSRPTLNNCILSENSDTNGKTESSQIFGGTPLMNYCCVQGWTGVLGGSGNMGEDPCFAKPSYWEDPCGTPENPWDDVWIDGDYHLLPDSPCIDVGDNSAPNLPAIDIDGHPRIIDGDCNDTDVVDMGAYEFSLRYLGDFDNDCNVDLTDFSIFGLAWMTKPGDAQWNRFCDISKPSDNYIDWLDAAILCNNWLAGTEP